PRQLLSPAVFTRGLCIEQAAPAGGVRVSAKSSSWCRAGRTMLPPRGGTAILHRQGHFLPMKRSTGRILTTHTGSLPRPPDLVAMMEGKDQREVRQNPLYDSRVKEAVAEAVRKQVEVGIDVPCDGEM